MTNNNKASTSSAARSRARRFVLFLYDLVMFLCSAGFLLAAYDGDNIIFTTPEIAYHLAILGISLFLWRLIFKVYDQIWRFGGIQCYIKLMLSDGVSFLFSFGVSRIVYYILKINNITTNKATFPRLLSIACITLLMSLAIRMSYRYAYKCYRQSTHMGKLMAFCLKIFAGQDVMAAGDEYHQKIKIAIIGAGRVGVGLAEELIGNKNSAYIPMCFIDTNKEKIGREIHGLKVLDEELVTHDKLKEFKIQEVVFALPDESDTDKKALYDNYRAMGFKIKVYDYPTMQKAGEKKRHLREFDVEELLFRNPLRVTNEKTSAFYKDKIVLITGGGGSIGSELCRQIAKMSPKQLIILDVYENGAYDVQQELRIAYNGEVNIAVEILSVCNRQALEKVFDEYRPNIVLHAAAHKHVPLMEKNCCEAIENNVFGTLNTVELSEKYRVERFMMVSTDKAVNPTNVMGATKRMCELIVQSHSSTSTYTTYSATRFGNVLGSAGSVIPLFKKQIYNGGPITITDKRIIRYFMTIPEASQLVLQSAAMAKNGELFVLDMGSPIKILDLAESMIKLCGFTPYIDIDIKETGLRPGEKLYEELLVKTEELDKTENSLIFIERDEPITQTELNRRLAILSQAVEVGDDNAAREALHKVVPTFKRPEEINAKAMESEEIKMASEQKENSL